MSRSWLYATASHGWGSQMSAPIAVTAKGVRTEKRGNESVYGVRPTTWLFFLFLLRRAAGRSVFVSGSVRDTSVLSVRV